METPAAREAKARLKTDFMVDIGDIKQNNVRTLTVSFYRVRA
jgi:hypothetical protein